MSLETPDVHRILIQLVASYTILAVFCLCAVAFVGRMFGLMRPDKATTNFLFGLFSLSTLGIITGAATDFLKVDIATAGQAVAVQAVRQEAIATNEAAIASGEEASPTPQSAAPLPTSPSSASSPSSVPNPAHVNTADRIPAAPKQLVFTQISREQDRGFARGLAPALGEPGYSFPGIELVDGGVSDNQVRYCNPKNKADAERLAERLIGVGLKPPKVLAIGKCNIAANTDILELWLKPSPTA